MPASKPEAFTFQSISLITILQSVCTYNWKMYLSGVTIVSLAGVDSEQAVEAILYSQLSIKFAEAKIISPLRPSNLTPNIVWEEIDPLPLRSPGEDPYSKFMIYELWRYIDTEHCLVVQGDGFVINPKKWSQRFLEYDYVGAPWPLRNDAFIDPFGSHRRVGNGGFSLRSKKLLEVPRHTEIPWDVNQGNFYKHMDAGLLHEDGNICVHNRHLYEEAGCVFAPTKVAAKFSQEIFVPEARWVRPFGFHRHKPRFWRSFFP